MRAEELIRRLDLRPHPEGGHFRETFRSPVEVTTARGRRSALTSILFLLRAGETSRWHAVAADETWYYHAGDPLDLWLAPPDGSRRESVRLGAVQTGHQPAHTVAADWWQAAGTTGAWTLVGCAVGPGFDFADFRLAADHPAAAQALARLPAPAADLL
jgi:predicted cupin superfamily sugar epimerase